MSATIATTTELFQSEPELRLLLQQRQVDLHAKRLPDTQRQPWWQVDSIDHPGFQRLTKGEQRNVVDPSDSLGYGHLGYEIGTEPLLRSIQVDGLEVGYISRNRYGAAVLNTPLLPMIDVDIKGEGEELWDPRLGGSYGFGNHYPVSRAELVSALRELTMGRFGREVDPIYPPGSTAFQRLVSYRWPAFTGEGEPPESGRELSAWVFRTWNGYRVVLHDPLAITDENTKAVDGLMRFLYSDRAYREIACQQKLWRSRLTRKPWRRDEPKGQPLEFEFCVEGGEVSYEQQASTRHLLEPLWAVLIADNSDLHPEEGYCC
jgi:hypothetical protein